MSGILNTVTANNVFIREWLNGCLIPLNLSMMTVITYTVWRQTKFSWGWTKYPGANSACALWWIFLADLMRSTAAWQLLHSVEFAKVPINDYHGSIFTVVYMVAAGIALGATLRCIWCLTPAKTRHATWIGALLFTVIFVLLANIDRL